MPHFREVFTPGARAMKTMLEYGFVPLQALFTATHPKGPEEGTYEARVQTDGTIKVWRRRADTTLVWTATFDDQISFAGWAWEQFGGEG